MSFIPKNKGSLIASFIILIISASNIFANDTTHLVNQARDKKLHTSKFWQALLHVKDTKPQIYDPRFILSKSSFSVEEELYQTIELLFGDASSEAICRFPARYLWISRELGLVSDQIQNCSGYNEFKSKAPLEKLYLIYASENLLSPSSMMGHIFLRMEGNTNKGEGRSHSLSFFTSIDTLNVPKLLIESILLGKEGFFSLSPYKEKEQIYLIDEQRNVWTYLLNLDDWQKELLQAHLWELKETKLTYFFHDYNCATFTFYVLAVADPRFLDFITSIDSPIDVAKAAKELNLIKTVSLKPSNKWKTRMLNDSISTSASDAVRNAVETRKIDLLEQNSLSPSERFLATELAYTYVSYLDEEGKLDKSNAHELALQVESVQKRLADEFLIDLSSYKDPLKSQKDSQFYTGLVSVEGQEYVNLGFLAAAKTREDDNRQNFGETELKLFDLSLLVSLENDPKVLLDEFSLYSVSSLMPWDQMVGGISGRFNVGFSQHYNNELAGGSAFDLSGGAGFTYELLNDVQIFSLASIGYGLRAGQSYFYAEPELGMLINEVFDMKTILTFHRVWNQFNERKFYNKLALTQSFFGIQDIGLFLDYERTWNSNNTIESIGVKLKYYF